MVGAEAAGVASGIRFNAPITGDANDTTGGKREIPDIDANLGWQHGEEVKIGHFVTADTWLKFHSIEQQWENHPVDT
jgi:hypothetical protein